MKLKTTKSQIKKSFVNIISIGYCDIQYLNYYKRPFAYSCGIYGWSCDYYDIDNICLSTGYSPIGQNVSYELIRKYELKAQKIVNDFDINYDIKVKKVNKLLVEFTNKCINE